MCKNGGGEMKNLRIMREALGVRKADLAKMARISGSSITMIENGQYEPSFKTTLAILGALLTAKKSPKIRRKRH